MSKKESIWSKVYSKRSLNQSPLRVAQSDISDTEHFLLHLSCAARKILLELVAEGVVHELRSPRFSASSCHTPDRIDSIDNDITVPDVDFKLGSPLQPYIDFAVRITAVKMEYDTCKVSLKTHFGFKRIAEAVEGACRSYIKGYDQ